MNVLLLDGHTVQAISVARALRSEGHSVAAFIPQRLSHGAVCRYIDRKIHAPESRHHSFIPFLENYLQQNAVDVVIPMFDDSAIELSRNKHRIEQQFGVRCAIPDFATFSAAHDKQRLMALCSEYGFPHPATHELHGDNIDEAALDVGFPAIIKPNISAGARGIVRVNSTEEIRARLPEIERQFGSCTLQRFIDHTGVYYNVMLYRTADGRKAAHTVIRIMRYFPLKGGTSCYCETVENERLVDICMQVLDRLGWVGFADFDIMEERRTGNFYIIEINPRVPASIHAAFVSGVNFPEIILRDTIGQPLPATRYTPGQALRFMGLDVMWFLFSPERFSFRPSWFRLCGRNLHYQDGSLHDPLPMLAGALAGVGKYLNPAFLKSKLKG